MKRERERGREREGERERDRETCAQEKGKDVNRHMAHDL